MDRVLKIKLLIVAIIFAVSAYFYQTLYFQADSAIYTYDTKLLFITALCFGIIFSAALYNLALAWYMRSREHLFYALVYRDSDQYFNPYYGMDNSFVFQVNDETQVRFIASFDRDEDETSNRGYTITFSKSWKDRYLIHLSGGTMKTAEFDESIAKLSLYMFL